MASCDWKKIKTAGEAKAMLRHSAEDEREKTEHSNKDIDTSKSYLNMTFGSLESYSEACKAYDERLAMLDSLPGANKRKDRVTMVGLEIPVPEGMDENKAREWFIDVYEIAYDEMGSDNVIGASAHFDECHEYRDAETKEMRMSRAHLHVYAIPERDGKLNAKAVTGRAAMIRMNNRIEAMTVEKYPGYRFMDGTKKKSRKSVEQLKAESDQLKVVEDAQAEVAKIIEEARQRADKMDAEASEKLWKAEEDREEARREREETREACVSNREALEADREALDAERQDFTRERSEWRKTANNKLTEAINKAQADASNARLMYQNAYEDAKGISQGFALESFYRSFSKALQGEMSRVPFRDGKNGWDVWGKYVNTALEHAKLNVTNTPQRQYEDRVAGRVARADKLINRKLPSTPQGQNSAGHDGIEF